MKKSLLVIVLLMVAALGFSADWIGMEYGLEIGWFPTASVSGFEMVGTVYSEDGETWYQWVMPEISQWWNTFRIVLDADVILWKKFFIGGSIASMFAFTYDDPIPDGFPIFSDFVFRTGFRIPHLEIGFQHLCTHPNLPNGYGVLITKMWGESAFDKVYIRVSGSF